MAPAGGEREVQGLTVRDVAAASGVSVRTLHHYDAMGLVSPGVRSTATYEKIRPGMAAFYQEAVHAYCAGR